MKLEDHIFAGIEAFGRGEQEHALLHACIAIDSTSQKRKSLNFSNKREYMQFIRDYYCILEPMTGSGVNFDKTFWSNVQYTDQNGKRVEKDRYGCFHILSIQMHTSTW
jgi:hypothetical protein